MTERERFEQMLPLELKPTEIRIWVGRNMKPMDTDAFDRLRINSDTIEFDLDRQTYRVSLREELLWIEYNFWPGTCLSIETCPN